MIVDLMRNDLRKELPVEFLERLAQAMATVDDAMDGWLAGPAATRTPSPEYVAFSALRMLVDGC